MDALSKNELKKTMPVETYGGTWGDRAAVTHLEAFGRTLSGIAPWLELGADNSEEGKLRKIYIDMTVQGLKNCVDPNSPDKLNFSGEGQPLVDAAFLANGLLRAPSLWKKLDETTQKRLLDAFKSTRKTSPPYTNWLLFSGTIEAALLKFEGDADFVRLEFALKKHEEWYLGDGTYGDGPEFHNDYYNSYVIQPMLLDIISVLRENKSKLKNWRYRRDYVDQADKYTERARRYAEIQERLISPEGTFPAVGRSIVYRFGAFQALSQMALRQELPVGVSPAQVRCALQSVIKRQLEMPGTFDEKGWLTLGFAGHQPELAEPYISTGSLYLSTEAFLVLGLPKQTEFWSSPDADWSQKKIWSGQKGLIDHAYYPSKPKEDKRNWETLISAKNLSSQKEFDKVWSAFYPWGNEHNGSARMYKSQVSVKDSVLTIKATPISKSEGKSKHEPFEQIKFRSGAIHAKHQILLSKQFPEYEISGEFKAPIAKGTWPAFWITAVNGWPPESDILEFKGDEVNWQNTFITQQNVTSKKIAIDDADKNWHSYKAVLKYIDDSHALLTYSIDGQKTAEHYTDFTGKPFWLIVNLQMNGSSGTEMPTTETIYQAKNIVLKRLKS